MRERLAALTDTVLEATIVGSFTAVGYRARRRLGGWSGDDEPLRGRTFLVTGATSGLGRATAAALAGRGGRVLVLGRDPERTARAADMIGAEPVIADLADLGSVRRAAEDVLARTDRLDALVNNAGALTGSHTLTTDGFELTYQTHVVAPYLLVDRLLPALQATPASVVVTVSSGGMYTERLSLRRLQMEPGDYDGVKAYARAKRAQVVLNQEWARRLHSPPVFQAMHPGWADTPGVVDSLPTFHRVTRPLLRTAEQGADTIVWLAATGGARPSGQFWLDRRIRRTEYLPGTGTEPHTAAALWDQVRRDAGLT